MKFRSRFALIAISCAGRRRRRKRRKPTLPRVADRQLLAFLLSISFPLTNPPFHGDPFHPFSSSLHSKISTKSIDRISSPFERSMLDRIFTQASHQPIVDNCRYKNNKSRIVITREERKWGGEKEEEKGRKGIRVVLRVYRGKHRARIRVQRIRGRYPLATSCNLINPPTPLPPNNRTLLYGDVAIISDSFAAYGNYNVTRLRHAFPPRRERGKERDSQKERSQGCCV